MRFTINHSLLLDNLNIVCKALSSKPAYPILTGLKMSVRQNSITLLASNSDISIQTVIEGPLVNIEEEGNILLPGKYFYDIIKKVECDNVEIVTFEENTVKILANRSNFTLISLDYSSYPLIVFDDSDINMSIDALNLKQLIRKTSFAASTNESRQILTGVNFQAKGTKLETAATDSFRVAKKHMVFDKEFQPISTVIPSKCLDELSKIIEDDSANVEAHFFFDKVLFKYKKVLFQTRLIEGKYPDTSAILPKVFVNEITFVRSELQNAVERAALFVNSEGTSIIKFELSNNNVKISSSNNEIGTVIEEVTPVKCTTDYPLILAFSSKYFLEALKTFEDNQVTLHFSSEIKPFTITSEHDYNLLQLLLPVRAF